MGASAIGSILGGFGSLASAFGSGGASGAPTSNLPAAQYYQPTGQPQADTQLQGFFKNYSNPYTPVGGLNSSYLTGPNAQTYANNAQNAADFAGARYNDLQGTQFNLGSQLMNNAYFGQGAVSNLMPQTVNPYSQAMIQGAGQAGGGLTGVGEQAISDASQLGGLASAYTQPLSQYANQGLQGLQGLASQTTAGLMPYAQQTAYSLPGLASSYAAPGNAAASSVLNTAFDPQGQLYGQAFQQNQDQTRAALAARGLNDSGTGAGIENQSNQLFNTNWQNQQLGRQTQGLSAYDANANQNYGMQSSAQGQGLNSLLSAASGTFSPYSTVYGQGVSGLNTAANTGYGLQSSAATQAQALGALGAGDIAQGAALPYTAYNTNLSDQIANLGNIGNLGNTYGNLGALGQSTYGAGIQSGINSGLAPYTMSGQVGQAINQYLTNAGQGQNFDQQMIGDLAQYLGLGQSAAQGLTSANYLQNKQDQQMYQNIGKLGANIGQYFGSSSLNSNPFSGYGSSYTASGMYTPNIPTFQDPSAFGQTGGFE